MTAQTFPISQKVNLPKFKNFDVFHMKVLLIHNALGIHCCNSARDYASKARLGDETRVLPNQAQGVLPLL